MTENRTRGEALKSGRANRLWLVGGVLLFLIVEAGSLAGGDRVNRLAEVLPGADKVLHTLAFVALSVAAQVAARRWSSDRIGAPAVAIALAVIAVADETGQLFQPARHVDLADLAASLAGVGLGLGWALRRRAPTYALMVTGAAVLVSIGVIATSYFQQRHIVIALQHARAGDFVAARREYQAAFDAGVRTPALFNELAWVEIESDGDAAVAVAFAAQALAARPDDPDVQDTYGWALLHVGRAADALPFLQRAYTAKPDMFCIHYHLGEVYLALGETDKALGHLQQQLQRPETREAARAAARLAVIRVQ